MNDICNGVKKCNICGKEFGAWDEADDFHIEKILGFGTRFDGKRLNIRLCSYCLENLIDNCEIDPIEDPDPAATEAEEKLCEAYARVGAANVAHDTV